MQCSTRSLLEHILCLRSTDLGFSHCGANIVPLHACESSSDKTALLATRPLTSTIGIIASQTRSVFGVAFVQLIAVVVATTACEIPALCHKSNAGPRQDTVRLYRVLCAVCTVAAGIAIRRPRNAYGWPGVAVRNQSLVGALRWHVCTLPRHAAAVIEEGTRKPGNA